MVWQKSKKQKAESFSDGDKKTAAMTTISEAISIPDPPNVFIYNEDTKDDIPMDVTHVKVHPSVKEIYDKAFEDRLSLVEVEISEGLERIGWGAFCDSTLKHINKLPSNLKEIGDGAFCRCERLDSIEFPEGLRVIGREAFAECPALKRIKIPSAHVVIKLAAFSHCSSLVSVELPEGLQVIGEGWFHACTSLTTVYVPSSVIKILFFAFHGCASLASLDLPEGLQSIGDRSFQDCKSLASLHIPSTVYKIGFGAFWGCTQLKDIHIPSSVVCIGASASDGCEQLTWVHLQGNLHTIKEGTFHGCDSLTHVRLPSSVTKIECSAFAHCPNLISLELPERLEIIDLRMRDDPDPDDEGEPKFGNYGCPSLMNLVIPSEQHFGQLDDGDDVDLFKKGFKLGTAASNFGDLVEKLQHRFDALPVHRLCYYQSYYPLTEAMENLMDADPAACTKVDAFGMTPFHILALSQTPNLSLFQALLTVYKVNGIHARDKFGSTPIDYLCLNHTHEATTAIQSLLPTILVNRLRWLGLPQWQSDILTLMNEALLGEGSSRRRAVGLLSFKLVSYERLESMSLLELALWKGNITDRGRNEDRSPKRPRLDKSHVAHVDRQCCRISSGAEVVISNVLPFLDKVCRHDYYSGD
jgi:hypothetical protein